LVPIGRRLAFALAAWSALAACRASAYAAQTFVALEYEVAPDAGGCPGVDEFRTSVARQLRTDPFRPAAELRVSVQIAKKETGFEGRIRWTDAEGNWVGDRKLTSRRSDCAEIGASLAFSVAVQIQLLTALAAAPPPEPPPPEPPPAVTPDVSVEPPPPPPEPPPAPTSGGLKLSVGLGPALGLRVAPGTTGLARLFVSGRVAWFSLELGAEAAWPATQRAADGTGFSLDRYAGGGAACGHAGALAGCVTATVGLLRARGIGVDVPLTPAGLFSQVGARITATQELGGRTFVTARLDGVVMLSTWTVTLNQEAAWTTPRVGALIGVDVGARFF
jgi:hypothetical protein